MPISFLAGIVFLISLSILSYERYVTVLRRHMKVNVSSYQKSCLFIARSWLYSLSPNNISYIICLFIFCLILPLLTMIYCYGKILRINGLLLYKRFHVAHMSRNISDRIAVEPHILFMVVSMVTCYLLCWMPYGIVSLIATFGKPGIISPTVSIVPSILAKTSTFVNPVLCPAAAINACAISLMI
uniref:G-protein coupled receptors family 1 profile domain-containing protein n=1 Tax=Chelonoidis abingdonii TaxID=106734 RepID=A0A8C0GUH9_CHEAB